MTDITKLAEAAGVEEIESILNHWKGANGGIYAIHGCALEVFAAVARMVAVAVRDAEAKALYETDVGKRAAEIEREACAKVCDILTMGDDDGPLGRAAARCARAIRARAALKEPR
jgi:hypothetical protein